MAVCSTTALRKYLTQRSNLGQPLREKAVSTTRGHAEGETLITSGAYRRPLFKSSQNGPRRLGQIGGGVLQGSDELGSMDRPFGGDHPELGQVTAQRVDGLGA